MRSVTPVFSRPAPNTVITGKDVQPTSTGSRASMTTARARWSIPPQNPNAKTLLRPFWKAYFWIMLYADKEKALTRESRIQSTASTFRAAYWRQE